MRRPQFIAQQARNATGLLGRVIANIMAKEIRGDNLWAIETLAPRPGQHILDLGTGHGQALTELVPRVLPGGSVTGVDPSVLMATMAASRNAAAVRDGSVRIVNAPAEHLPFADCVFDAAMAVHVLYFWDELTTPLSEIARVLKPGGRLVLLFRPASDPRTSAFPASVYTFHDVREVTATLEGGGFVVARINPPDDRQRTVAVRATRR